MSGSYLVTATLTLRVDFDPMYDNRPSASQARSEAEFSVNESVWDELKGAGWELDGFDATEIDEEPVYAADF